MVARATEQQEDPRILALEQEDFRMYAPIECKNRHGKTVKMRLCEELVAGRWEPFYSIVSQEV